MNFLYSVAKSVYVSFIHLSKLLSRKGLYPFLRKEFQEIGPSKTVLTIGSGGEIHELLQSYSYKNNFKVISFDISEERNPDLLGDICTYDFKGKKFDIIVIAEVLEHLHSPHLAIDNIQSILLENGKLILTVPFIFPIHEQPFDYYRYTKYGLEFLLQKFSNVSISERNSWIEAINVLLVRLIMDKQLISRLLAPIFIIIAFLNLPIVWLISKLIKTDFITTGYLVTAYNIEKKENL